MPNQQTGRVLSHAFRMCTRDCTGFFPTSSPGCSGMTMLFYCQEREDVGLNSGRKDQEMLSGYAYCFRASTILPYGHTRLVLGPFLP